MSGDKNGPKYCPMLDFLSKGFSSIKIQEVHDGKG
jgi:hypothetical protein